MKKTKKIVFAGVLAALCCISTLYISVPFPVAGGYFNLGDCFVITSGVVLGPVFGFFAAAIGSMLADLLAGYAVYAPGTFLIKGLMALVVGLLYIKNKKVFMIILSAVIAELIMVLGYFVYEFILTSSPSLALLTITGNLMQGAAGFVSSVSLILLITKNKAIKKFLFE